ncbi:hypothetical protein ACW4YW_15410 [Methylobacillus pratensis]
MLTILSGCERHLENDSLSPAEKVALFKSVRLGDIQLLDKSLKAGISPNLYSSDLGYLITSSIYSNNSDALKLLISYGVDVNPKKKNIVPPLIDALLILNCSKTLVLLQAGSRVNVKLTANKAAEAALSDTYKNKNAKELYQMNKSDLLASGRWDNEKECWLKVEKYLH